MSCSKVLYSFQQKQFHADLFIAKKMQKVKSFLRSVLCLRLRRCVNDVAQRNVTTRRYDVMTLVTTTSQPDHRHLRQDEKPFCAPLVIFVDFRRLFRDKTLSEVSEHRVLIRWRCPSRLFAVNPDLVWRSGSTIATCFTSKTSRKPTTGKYLDHYHSIVVFYPLELT